MKFQSRLPLLLLVLIPVVVAFEPVRHLGFLAWDDGLYVTSNAHVLAGLTREGLWWALTSMDAPYWQPLARLSHMTDISMFGTDAGAHHLVNLAWHAVNTALVFVWLVRMTRAAGASAFVAAIFGVHPLHVESVAWIAERKDVLSTTCLLLTLLAYTAYTARPTTRRYLIALALYAAALMAKPMVVTLPALLLLLDVWPLQRVKSDERARWKTRLLEKTPFAALAIACAVVTFVAQQRAGAVAGTAGLSVSDRGQGAVVACILYIWKAVWPVGLAIFYPRFGPPVWAVIGSAAFLITVTVFALRRIRTQPYVFVGWAWWLVGLAPVLGFVQVGEQAYADRFMYVPLIGLAIVVAWSVADATRNVIGPRVVAVAASLVILACTAAARAQVQTWTDDVTVWARAVAVTADNYYAESNLGVALGERGDRSGARRHLENALALRPGDPDIQNELGQVEAGDGRLEAARERFAAVVLARPSFAEAHHNLGMTWLRLNAPQQAIDEFTTALALNSNLDLSREGLGHAHADLGRAAALAGRMDDAFAELTESLRWQPREPDVQCDLAVILRQRGDVAGARAALERALAVAPGHPRATRMLASLGR